MFNGKVDNGSFAAKWILSSIAYLILSLFLGSFMQSENLLATSLLMVFTLYVVVFRLSLYVRRLRDANKNVWISVISLIPLLDILLFLMLLFGLNKWAVIAVTIITIFFSIMPIIFIAKIVGDNNIENNSLKLSSCYLLAKDGIYYYELSEFNTYKKLDTDPDQFTTIDEEFCYGMDNKNVFFREQVLEGENPDTFVVTEDRYNEDNDKYYVKYRKLYNNKE